MDWAGEGIVLRARPHGESAAIVDVLTPDLGLHRGVVRGGTGRKLAPVLQPGNSVQLTWRARLDEHLGAFTVEPLRARTAAILPDADRLAALSSACALAVFALPERDPHPRLYLATERLVDALASGDAWHADYLTWERLLLEETGFGLDLSSCAVTGATVGLAYVSPRTGRAVTRLGAGDFADRLLPLPALLLTGEGADDRAAMAQGLATTGHFIDTVLAPALGERPVPQARGRLADRFRP